MWEILDNTSNQQKDVVIVSVPWIDTLLPLPGPATLKQPVESLGLSCLAVDVNIEMTLKIKNHPYKNDYMDFLLKGKISENIEEEILNDIMQLADKILSWKPKWIGISLFARDTQNFGKWLIYFLNKKRSRTKIIVGGPGCGVTGTGDADIFIPQLFRSSMIDYHIQGDGEISLKELLRGNENYPGINGKQWQYLTNEQLETIPYPDYSDYKLKQFWKENMSITLTSSRGCVRNCTFCDYIESHTRFQWRKAENVFEEMLLQNKKFGITKFNFADSLINGNVKEFNNLIELIARHNKTNPDNSFTWGAYYIFRNKSANDEWTWKTIKESGCVLLSVGIEHFSQKVRYSLGKKFDDESIVHHLELASKYGVKILGLMLIGYPTETEEDRECNLNWINTYSKFNKNLIFSLSKMQIIPNTQVSRMSDKLGILINENLLPSLKMKFWESSIHMNNEDLREQWLKQHVSACYSNGFKLDADLYSNLQARNIIEEELMGSDAVFLTHETSLIF